MNRGLDSNSHRFPFIVDFVTNVLETGRARYCSRNSTFVSNLFFESAIIVVIVVVIII